MNSNKAIESKPTLTVNIRTYDVWGNAEDGYEVNDTYNHSTVEFDGTEDDLCSDTVGFLNEHYFTRYVAATALSINIEDNGDYLDITVESAEDGEPLLELTIDRTSK